MRKLNRRQISKLSDIFSDIGLVFLATVVIPAVLDRFKPFVLAWGMLGTAFFWTISLRLKK